MGGMIEKMLGGSIDNTSLDKIVDVSERVKAVLQVRSLVIFLIWTRDGNLVAVSKRNALATSHRFFNRSGQLRTHTRDTCT